MFYFPRPAFNLGCSRVAPARSEPHLPRACQLRPLRPHRPGLWRLAAELHDPPRRPGGLAAWQERRAKELLVAHLDGAVALADIAKECRLSVGHFSRVPTIHRCRAACLAAELAGGSREEPATVPRVLAVRDRPELRLRRPEPLHPRLHPAGGRRSGSLATRLGRLKRVVRAAWPVTVTRAERGNGSPSPTPLLFVTWAPAALS